MLESAPWFVAAFEAAVVHEAGRRKVAGVVCGHIHRPALRPAGPILYCNTGDWVDSCSALLEHLDGRLELVSFAPVAGREAGARDTDLAMTGPPSGSDRL